MLAFHVALALLVELAVGKVLLVDALPHILKLVVTSEKQRVAIFQLDN